MTQPNSTLKQTGNQPNSSSDLALGLAGLGWYVFPCNLNKTPRVRWKTLATTDPATIRAWWGSWSDSLIGIYCERSGFFALDIDRKTEDGFLSLSDLIDSAGDGRALLPLTGPAQSTPSGGAHYLFALPPDVDIPNVAGKLGPGLDLRSAGYICTGDDYAWLSNHGPEMPLTDAPAWLLAEIGKLAAKKFPQATTKPAVENNGQLPVDSGEYWLGRALRMAVPGTRNWTGFWLACQLRDAGLTQAEADQVMSNYTAGVPGDGYSEQEALYSCAQAFKAARRDPAKRSG